MTRSDFLLRLLALLPFFGRQDRIMSVRLDADGRFFAPDGTHLGWARIGELPRWNSERLKRWAFAKYGRRMA